MARLNEPPLAAPAAGSTTLPPAPETLDGLKRRFIRQNRELAKNNSSQSLRIRSLELEISRLLADNLELRHQVLQLQNEMFMVHSRGANVAAAKLKEELGAKIAELSGIVERIDDTRGREQDTKEERRPLEGNWRERQPLSELMRDTLMPTISEDKLYPRRTLDSEDIRSIRLSDHSSTGSPDLGPPPVAHFDCEDPVKNASPTVKRKSPEREVECDGDDLPSNFSIHLETRRRRKDVHAKADTHKEPLPSTTSKASDFEQTSILRTGAKRKLGDREVERKNQGVGEEHFSFVRRATRGGEKDSLENATSRQSTRDFKALETAPRSQSETSRKALGEKSANMSPRKVTSVSEKDPKGRLEKPDARKLNAAKEAAPTRKRRVSLIPTPTAIDDIAETIEIAAPEPEADPEPVPEMQPITPAPPDFLSPTPSEPSAKPEGRGDTPPPAGLATLGSAASDDISRPSRRARSAVNYAEPSLVAKMRRPEKKMVDAISGLQDPRRAMNASSTEKKAMHDVAIKDELLEDDAMGTEIDWRGLPPASAEAAEPRSPLIEKSINSSGDGRGRVDDAIRLTDETTTRATTAAETGENDRPRPTTSTTLQSQAITSTSRLLPSKSSNSSSRRSISIANESPPPRLPRRQSTTDLDLNVATECPDDLDIYDFKESSSPLSSNSGAGGSGGGSGDRARPIEAKSLRTTAPATTSAVKLRTQAHRRHSSAPKDLPGSSAGLASAVGSEGGIGSVGSGGASVAAPAGRSDRAASRRRSMML